MSTDFSFEAMLGFLDYAANHGLWKAATAKSYATAASKIEDELTEQEAQDVRSIDLDLVFQRFVNRNKVSVSPSTLRTYKRRVANTIEEFVAWREDPAGYRPKMNSRERSKGDTATTKERSGEEREEGNRTERGTRQSSETSPGPTSNLLTIPFPLRPDFVVSVQVPRDLKTKEADRLAAFIRTLASDFGEE